MSVGSLQDIFDCDPLAFLDGPERLELFLAESTKQHRDGEYDFVLRHWEGLMGVPCPRPLASLIRAYANTGALNTALYRQGGPLVVCPAGFGNLLTVPEGEDPDSYEPRWDGCFIRYIKSYRFVMDVLYNQVELGGDPYYYYGLGDDLLEPNPASSLSALVYACTLRNARRSLSSDLYIGCLARVAPMLAEHQAPATSLLEDLPEELIPEFSWEPPPVLRDFHLVESASIEEAPNRDWFLRALKALDRQNYLGEPVPEDTLVLIRELVRLAVMPEEIDSTSDAVYAGLHAFILTPEQLDGWTNQALEHTSPFVRDAALTIQNGDVDLLVELRTLVDRSRNCRTRPNARAQRCAVMKEWAMHHFMHGRS